MTKIMPPADPQHRTGPHIEQTLQVKIMNIIILIAALSTLISGGFLLAFLWATGNGQYDDDYGPPRRILFDSGSKEKSKHKEQ